MSVKTARKLDLRKLHLESGGHSPDSKFCVMEAAAYVAGEAWSDKPKCVSPAIGAFLRSWNDNLGDKDRQRLKPYIRKVLDTATTRADEQIRAWMAVDWLVRTFTPAWLDLASLDQHAASLRSLPELSSADLAKEAMATIKAAGAAAWAAAGDAAGDAARAAARAAAWAAAWDAAWDALAPTVASLQDSAFELLDRMIAVGKVAA